MHVPQIQHSYKNCEFTTLVLFRVLVCEQIKRVEFLTQKWRHISEMKSI